MATKKGDDQEKIFADASTNVKRHAFYMRRALDEKNMDEALVKASNMIYELRTSKLFPTKYYELYINVTNELHQLESWIEEKFQRMVIKTTESERDATEALKWLETLYEEVQYRPNIVPRLYLLMTVGSVRIKVVPDPVAQMQVINDLVEMTKGVQHPTRGLFLRNYLSSKSRAHLPDVDDEHQERDESVQRAITFVLQNFGEMTRLWVRMQHQGAVRDRTRREKERMQLRMLVGTNLKRLSELQSVSLKVYRDQVLPKLTEQITKCKDKIAQEYLMDCVIHVFADEYHMATLDTFLGTCGKLHSSCNVRVIIESLMNRLATFAEDSPAAFAKEDVFPKFQKYCNDIVSKHKKMKLQDRLSLQCALVNFAARCYPDRDEYVANVIKSVYELLEKEDAVPAAAVPHVEKVITSPLASMQLKVLEIDEYLKLIGFLKIDDARSVSRDVVQSLVDTNCRLENPEQIDRMFTILETLIKDKKEIVIDDNNRADFEDEQNLIQLIICTIGNDDMAVHFAALKKAKTFFDNGGKARQAFTYPCLIYNALALVDKVHKAEQEATEDNPATVKAKKIFQFIYSVMGTYAPENPLLAIRMFCNAGISADHCNYTNISYEFLTQAFLYYEDEISDSTEQFDTIRLLAGTVQQCMNFDEENFETLRTKATQHSSKLLKKHSQSRAVYTCSHLYWNTEFKGEEKVLKCLQRSLKICKNIMDDIQKANVFVEILNTYAFYVRDQCSSVAEDTLGDLKSLIENLISEFDEDLDEESTKRADETRTFYRNTVKYIQAGADEE